MSDHFGNHWGEESCIGCGKYFSLCYEVWEDEGLSDGKTVFCSHQCMESNQNLQAENSYMVTSQK